MNKKILLYVMLIISISLQAQTYISCEEELAAISENLAGHYVLTADITLSKEWTPISVDNPFKGILDGNGYRIKNLRIVNDNQSAVGFFAKTDGAHIKNLGIENAEVTAGKEDADGCSGIFIGEAKSTVIVNCYVYEGFVEGKGSTGSFIGKVVKGNVYSSIRDSYSTADVVSGLSNAGGLIGLAENVNVENAYFAGTAEAQRRICGGIIGSSTGDDSVSSCVVLSSTLKGVIVNRIVGENTRGKLLLSNNYARADLMTGLRNLAVVPVNQSYIKRVQGENVPYLTPEYVSDFSPYTETDINNALTALNNNYYSTSRKLYFERYTKTGKVSAIWTQAIFWDIAMNAFKRTGSATHKKLMDDLFEGNRIEYANYDWDNGVVWFIYDDIMWWVIALARAYELTGDDKYLELAESGFERVWSGSKVLKDKGSYDPVNGGMFWAWDQNHPEGSPLPTMGKMACINYPTVIGAMTLYNATNNTTYLNKAKEIYLWSRNNLFDKEIGRVADSKHGSGNPAWIMHVYNQATCIGAAVMLYKETSDRMYLEDAVLAANYTKNQMSTNGYMHFEKGIEQGIYHAIFAQYIIRLIEDGEQYQYLPWLRFNINAGWKNRLPVNITYKDYGNPAPAISQIESYDASGIPALMQVIPTVDKVDKEVNAQSRIFYEKNLNWDFNTTWKIPENASLPQLISSNTSQGLKTNLENMTFDMGSWTIDPNGLNSNLTGQGDGFMLSNTTARNFVFEVDVKFNNRNESAASLVFGSNNDLERKNMYVANIHAHNGVARLFKFQDNPRGVEALDLVGHKTISPTPDNQYHLSVTVIGNHIVFSINGEVVSNTADYTTTSVYGQNNAFIGSHLGLLSWNADCVYQNLYVTELNESTNPQLSHISLQAQTGEMEHNIQFDSAQYVYIAYVSNETEQVNILFDKASPATLVETKMGNTDYPNNILPLQEGINFATLVCENGQAKVLYQLVIIRRENPDLYYNEFDRGQYHFSVKEGWANDPNGMVYYKGEYHLFHQFYYGINWGPMHWGHSVSRDLIHWEELPIAFYPDEYGTMYSGSAVIDEDNTSGLFREEDDTFSETGGLVAIITANGNGERVILAYSKDGRNWKKHEGVILDWTEDPLFNRDFRDPKVFRYQNKWFMVIAGGPLRIYSSDNLIDWQVESTYADLYTECPDMFPLSVSNGEPNEQKWVLSRGGRYYKVGDFKQVDGKWQFVPDAQYTGGGTGRDGVMNFASDAYATQTYHMGSFDTPQRVVAISWMNFHAPNLSIDNGNLTYNGTFTLQNELSLLKDDNGKYLLQQTPITEYQSLRDLGHTFSASNWALDGETNTLDFNGDSYEIVAEFTLNGATEVGFNVRTGDGFFTKVSYMVSNNMYMIDRRKTGTGPSYYLQRFMQTSPISVVEGKVKLHIFVDRNTVELFGGNNTVAGSAFIYPPSGSDGVEIFASNGSAVADVKIYPLKTIWHKSGSGTGIEDKEHLSKKNDIDIRLKGRILWINSMYPEKTNVKIYDILGNLMEDFGRQQKDEYLLSSLYHGIYIVSVETPFESKSQKIILN